MSDKTKKIKQELNTIKERNGGMLDPQAVVDFARNKKTALHSQFCWDDSKAAQEYRLWQARMLIRVQVVMLPQKPDTPIRAFVSLQNDRNNGGYRAIDDVMASKHLRDSLIEQALRDMTTFQNKYQVLDELAGVFAEMRSVVGRVNKRKAKELVAA